MLVGIKRNKYSNENYTRCRKCPNTEFLPVRIFPYSDWVQGFTKQICIFSSNAGKYGPEKTPYLDTFHIVYSLKNPVKIAIKKFEHHPSINWVLKKILLTMKAFISYQLSCRAFSKKLLTLITKKLELLKSILTRGLRDVSDICSPILANDWNGPSGMRKSI